MDRLNGPTLLGTPRAQFGGAFGHRLKVNDVLELDGRDLRNEPWARRRTVLAQLLADADAGIRLCEHIEDVDGALVFRQACVMSLEGIVAKRRDSRYRSRRCREWIKIKNSAHPAIDRVASPLIVAQRSPLAAIAAKNRLPGMYPFKENVQAGGLMSYGADRDDLYRRANVLWAKYQCNIRTISHLREKTSTWNCPQRFTD